MNVERLYLSARAIVARTGGTREVTRREPTCASETELFRASVMRSFGENILRTTLNETFVFENVRD